ncbi:MAG: ParB family transcriptional regulator, chromosome partitioning protein [Actinomycetota bacterium]|jgi:ParB family chromosome partitioning protein|nr:ParB family transcriptional regulator, chromosome partitioning protein [Actinomycetota bacterium]
MSDQTHPTPDRPPAAEFAMLDPATLLTDHNLRPPRTDAAFADLVASIREHGVLVPIVATRDHQGVRVRCGHRRALAAVEAGREMVPVVVYTGALTDATAAEVDRILGQHAENTHRVGLTTGETVAAFGQLAALGVTPARIARRSKTPRRTVDAALAAAGSEVASKATGRWDFLTLDDAAALAEFDDDPDAIKQLVTAAKTGENTAHLAQRLRDQRATTTAIATLATQLKAAGVPVIAEPPYDEKTIRRLEHLRHDGKPLTAESHAACPGHAAYVKRSWGQEKAETVYVCVHPRLHGHTDLNSRTPAADRPTSDQEKAERRRIRANNDAWRSAEKVRRAWLRDFLTRRTPPQGSGAFVATALAHGDHALTRALTNGHHRARDLFRLGHLTDEPESTVDRRRGKTLTGLLDGASDNRALVVALGIILAAHEDTWTTDTWRRPSTANARYLTFLMTNGYTPAEVEQLVLGAAIPVTGADSEPDAEEADTDQ